MTSFSEEVYKNQQRKDYEGLKSIVCLFSYTRIRLFPFKNSDNNNVDDTRKVLPRLSYKFTQENCLVN